LICSRHEAVASIANALHERDPRRSSKIDLLRGTARAARHALAEHGINDCPRENEIVVGSARLADRLSRESR
jgi:hypothetical protein